VRHRTRKAKLPVSRRPAKSRGGRISARTGAATTPELAAVIRALMAAGRVTRRPTLGAVRAALQKGGFTWSKEGELLFPQDRTALVIELDELIDRFGMRARAGDFLARKNK
jgi:hypothetical protein